MLVYLIFFITTRKFQFSVVMKKNQIYERKIIWIILRLSLFTSSQYLNLFNSLAILVFSLSSL